MEQHLEVCKCNVGPTKKLYHAQEFWFLINRETPSDDGISGKSHCEAVFIRGLNRV